MVKALSPTSKWGWDKLDDYWRLLPSAVSFVKEGDGMITTEGKMVTSRIIECLAKNATANGAEFIFNTKAEQLVKDDSGKVCGVIATAEDGSHVQYNAVKGVILATGDISGNKAMLKDWAPITLRADVCGYYPAGGNMGDGITMGLWAGAALSKSPSAPMVHLSNQQSVLSARLMCWLAVNREGLRYGAEMPVEPLITNARMNQPGNVAWSIYDGNFAQFVQQQNPESYESMLYSIDRATGEQVYIQSKIDNAVNNGLIITADTLEELAEEVGMPVDTFLATVERYNKWCDSGVDEDFGVPANWLSKIGVPPFYAEPVPTTMLVCIMGLHVNNDSQVCNADDEPIPGLFAVGNVQGDFFGNSYTVHCPGISHGRAITFGNLVGAALAQDTVISKTA
ncbi:MAG: FAD-binding protein [Coriobacteriales bacterium]|nr:FAD-binding protein [Coriobacteriales bacterium]